MTLDDMTEEQRTQWTLWWPAYVLQRALGVDFGKITIHVRDGVPTGVLEVQYTVKVDRDEMLELTKQMGGE